MYYLSTTPQILRHHYNLKCGGSDLALVPVVILNRIRNTEFLLLRTCFLCKAWSSDGRKTTWLWFRIQLDFSPVTDNVNICRYLANMIKLSLIRTFNFCNICKHDFTTLLCKNDVGNARHCNNEIWRKFCGVCERQRTLLRGD